MLVNIASGNSSSKLALVDEESIQPNAVDLRIDRIWRMGGGVMILSEEEKKHREKAEVMPDSTGWYILNPGSYEISFDNFVTMGPDEAGYVITRSTLNRNGVHITSGLYDSGYSGIMAACIHINGGPLKIKKGTRVGQFIIIKAEALHAYDGSYGFKDGVAKEEEKRYHE